MFSHLFLSWTGRCGNRSARKTCVGRNPQDNVVKPLISDRGARGPKRSALFWNQAPAQGWACVAASVPHILPSSLPHSPFQLPLWFGSFISFILGTGSFQPGCPYGVEGKCFCLVEALEATLGKQLLWQSCDVWGTEIKRVLRSMQVTRWAKTQSPPCFTQGSPKYVPAWVSDAWLAFGFPTETGTSQRVPLWGLTLPTELQWHSHSVFCQFRAPCGPMSSSCTQKCRFLKYRHICHWYSRAQPPVVVFHSAGFHLCCKPLVGPCCAYVWNESYSQTSVSTQSCATSASYLTSEPQIFCLNIGVLVAFPQDCCEN